MKNFKLRKVGPNDGRKVTEIKIVPKVRIQHIVLFIRSVCALHTDIGFLDLQICILFRAQSVDVFGFIFLIKIQKDQFKSVAKSILEIDCVEFLILSP